MKTQNLPMMKPRSRFLAFSSAALLAVGASSQAVVVFDGFDDGGFTNGADPLDVEWTNNGGSLSVQTSGTLLGTGNELRVHNGGFDLARAYLPTTSLLTLGVGQTITLSFDIIYENTPGNATDGLRVGLFDSQGYGTGISIGTGANTSIRVVRDSVAGVHADMFGGSAGNLVTFNGAGDSFQNGTMLSGLGTTASFVELRITRTSETQMDIWGSVNGGVATAVDVDNSDPSDYIYDFSGGHIVLKGGLSATYRIDNVTIMIPEPSVALLGGFCLMGGLLRRRR